MIELVGQSTAAGGFGQVMGFIDNDGIGLVLDQGFFHRLPQITDTNGW